MCVKADLEGAVRAGTRDLDAKGQTGGWKATPPRSRGLLFECECVCGLVCVCKRVCVHASMRVSVILETIAIYNKSWQEET